tara:strand:- start:902 stop:1276 length:375 start_codon:yes stop_codon:yes gene_type:complete
MKYFISAVVAVFMVTTAHAHEWTPTYPKFEPSFLEDIVVTQMNLFNKRKDVEYYEIEVFDEDWKPVPFATTVKLIHLEYLEQKQIDLYVREIDYDRIEYICTVSRLLIDNELSSGINSRICSKV